MTDIKAIQVAVNNAHKVAKTLAAANLFVEAGVLHSLVQIINVQYHERLELEKQVKEAQNKEATPAELPPAKGPCAACAATGKRLVTDGTVTTAQPCDWCKGTGTCEAR